MAILAASKTKLLRKGKYRAGRKTLFPANKALSYWVMKNRKDPILQNLQGVFVKAIGFWYYPHGDG